MQSVQSWEQKRDPLLRNQFIIKKPPPRPPDLTSGSELFKWGEKSANENYIRSTLRRIRFRIPFEGGSQKMVSLKR